MWEQTMLTSPSCRSRSAPVWRSTSWRRIPSPAPGLLPAPATATASKKVAYTSPKSYLQWCSSFKYLLDWPIPILGSLSWLRVKLAADLKRGRRHQHHQHGESCTSAQNHPLSYFISLDTMDGVQTMSAFISWKSKADISYDNHQYMFPLTWTTKPFCCTPFSFLITWPSDCHNDESTL